MTDRKTISALRSAGLSEKEAIVYIDLLSNGESRTGAICNRTSIPSSNIYATLSNLKKLGLVNFKLVNNVKVFRSSDPDALALLFEEKEARVRHEKEGLLGLISSMKSLPKEAERFQDFKFFKGMRGIKSMYVEIIHSWKHGDEYCIASAPLESFKRLEPFFVDVVHRKRIRDGVRVKMIVDRAGERYGLRRERMPLAEIRYLDIDTKTEYGVLNDLFFLVSYGKEPYALLIKDRNFADTYKVFFGLLWNQAR